MTRLLDRISIASPCSANWEEMTGDDRRRFCASCRLHVHDLGQMTTREAEELLREAAVGRVCVRFFRRADGRVLTRDCPVGLRQRLRAGWARAAALAAALWGAAVACVRSPSPAATPPAPGAPAMGEMMGDVAAPPIPPDGMGRVAAPVEPKK